MSDATNQSVAKALRLFETLFEDGFEGRSLKEVRQATGIPASTAWRLLKTLEVQGWVVEVPMPGQQESRWRVSAKLASIADAYQQHMIARAHGIKQEFFNVTGRSLNA